MVSFPQKEHYDLADFRQVIEILRHPGGCPWDQEQTHHSIRRNLLEEAYEAAEAIDTENTTLLQEELGDVLMQVLFHSSIEADAGRFDLDDVADMAVKKLIFRHPHVFGSVDVADSSEVLVNWDALKRQEKHQESYTDTLDAVARSLPALWRAEKVQKKPSGSEGFCGCGEHKDEEMIECMCGKVCGGWVHFSCAGINLETFHEDERDQFICKWCRAAGVSVGKSEEKKEEPKEEESITSRLRPRVKREGKEKYEEEEEEPHRKPRKRGECEREV